MSQHHYENNRGGGGELLNSTVFIGDLNKDVVEKDLIDSLSIFGEVISAIIKRSRTTQHPLGYGFVTMASSEIAQRCVLEGQNIIIKGRKIRIGKAQRNSSLLVSQIHQSVTLATLIDIFNEYGEVISQESTYYNNGLYYSINVFIRFYFMILFTFLSHLFFVIYYYRR